MKRQRNGTGTQDCIEEDHSENPVRWRTDYDTDGGESSIC